MEQKEEMLPSLVPSKALLQQLQKQQESPQGKWDPSGEIGQTETLDQAMLQELTGQAGV